MAFVPSSSFRSYTRQIRQSSFTCARRLAIPTLPPSFRMCDPPQENPVPLSDLNKLRSTTSEQPDTPASTQPPEEDFRSDKQKESERLRAAEKFITIDEGKFECLGCGYVYDPNTGERKERIPPGTPFSALPSTYACSVCRTPKAKFEPKKKVIAGFADNQSYGFGTNSLTGGQKNSLIFGALLVAFLFLLSGYALN